MSVDLVQVGATIVLGTATVFGVAELYKHGKSAYEKRHKKSDVDQTDIFRTTDTDRRLMELGRQADTLKNQL